MRLCGCQAGKMENVNMNEQTSEFQREGLSIPEACTVAGLGRTSIYDAIAAGNLPARKFGKRTIILRGDLNNFLAALPLMTA
jgi:excisionase family DNA binding protein